MRFSGEDFHFHARLWSDGRDGAIQSLAFGSEGVFCDSGGDSFENIARVLKM